MMRRLLLGLAAVLLVACGPQGEDATPSQAKSDAETPKNPGYLRLPLDGNVSTLDPGLTQFTDAIELVEQLFLGLTDFDPATYSVVPELASHWDVSKDGMVYTFYLRRDAVWTHGRPVTAQDIEWAVQRNIDPTTQSPYSHTLYILKNAKPFHEGKITDVTQLGVKALDDYTVEFQLENPAGYFPAVVSLWVFRPLPKEVLEKFNEDWTNPGNIQTNGSYQLAGWQKGASLILKKNPDYFDAYKVNIEEIRYYVVPESSLGLDMYEGNELDVLGESYLRIPLSELPRLRSDPELRRDLRSMPHFCTEIYAFNNKLPPTDNVLVRKAIIAAINKNMLLDFVVKGEHEPATTFTRPPIFGSVDPEEEVGIGFDPMQAKAWLAEAGYPDGKGFPGVVLVHNSAELHNEISKGLKTMLKHYLNIEMTVKSLDFDDYVKTLFDPKDTHLSRVGWCADYPDANNWLFDAFHPTDSPNFARWDNAEFANLTSIAQKIPDPQDRQNLYRRAEEILNTEQAAILPLYFSSAIYLVKPWVKNWHGMAFGGQHIRNWSIQNDP